MSRGSAGDLKGLLKQLKSTLDRFLNEGFSAHVVCFDISRVNHILSDLQIFFQTSNEEAKRDNDYVREAEFLDAWYKFQNWLFGCVFAVEKQSEIWKCLFMMCSLVLNWTDKGHEFRLSLINKEYLFYHVMQLKSLEVISTTKVAEKLVTYHIAVITNCAQELNFHNYVSTITWKAVLSPWVKHSSQDLQLQTRLLCCYVSSSFDHNDLEILDMGSKDLKTLLTMLGRASTSTEFKASGFGFTFSATEILESLLNLFISSKNLRFALSMDLIPTFLALLLNGSVQDRLLTCQLLWILLGEPNFQLDEELYCSSIKEILIAMVDDDDKSLQVVSKLLLIEPCFGQNDFDDELQAITNFFQLSPDKWYHIGQFIGLSKSHKFILSLSALSVNKRVLFVLLLQKLNSIHEFFSLLSPDIIKLSSDLHYIDESSDTKYPQSVWLKKTLDSCEAITQQFLKASAADKNDFFDIAIRFWHQVSEFINVCVPSVLKSSVDEYAANGRVFSALYGLLELLYKAEMAGLGTKDIRICFLRLVKILRDWCSISKQFCSSLLNRGLVLNNCDQLLNLTRKTYSEMVEFLVKAHLRILISCSHCNEFKVYLRAFDWLTMLAQLRSTEIPAVRLATKILSCYLSSTNPELFIGLSDSDVNRFLDIAAKAAGSSYELDKFTFYSLDMINCLQMFIEGDSRDVSVLTQAPVMPALVAVLSDGTLEEKSAISLLVWSILSARKYDLSGNMVYSDLLQAFEGHREIEDIAEGIIALCEKDCADFSAHKFDLLIKTTYKYGRYTECISWCLKKETRFLSDSQNLQTSIIHAKALFHLYKHEQNKLRFILSTSAKEDYYKALKNCYERAKKVIILLGVAHDCNCLDSEGSKMLGLSMMDLIHTTNELNDCKRCYLCWKKLIASPEEMCDSKEKSKPSKLIRSHPIPCSLLDRFAQSVPAGRNLKLFRSSAEGTQMEMQKGNVYAPKQITRYMFCTSCENVLSAKGETQFARDFFDKIYDSSDTSKPCQSQVLHYDKWLYHFCAGLIYRNLIWEKNCFLNEDELYKLLLGCREYILSSELSDNSPEIYLLMTPIASDEEDRKHGAINHVLSGTLEWHIGKYKLGSDSFENEDAVFASFYLFHLGVINILVKLSPSQAYSLDDHLRIEAKNPQTYFIPDEKERKKALPPGLWAHLLSEARSAEEDNLVSTSKTSSQKRDSRFPKAVEMFGIVSGTEQQLSEAAMHGIQPSPGGSEKKFDFLPAGFEVRSASRPNSVLLPKGHSILLHHTFAHGTGTGETIFIVRNVVKDTCYLIWNNFIPGLQYSVAFHLSPSEMLLKEVVTDKQPPRALLSPHFQATLEDARKKLSTALPHVLLQKGIFNLESLLMRAKRIESFPSVDMKCSKETKCWFCSNRCNVCFKILGIDSIRAQVNETEVSVCKQDCAWYLPGRTIQTSIVVANPEETPPPSYSDRSCPLFDSHRKYFHVYIEGTAENLPMKGDIAICFGDGSVQYPDNKMYGVYFSSSVNKQLIFEFFLSDSFEFLRPLPHDLSNNFLISLLKVYEENEVIKQYLSLAYEEFIKPAAVPDGNSAVSSPDLLYTMICAMAEDMKSCVSKTATDEISMKLTLWNKDFLAMPLEDRDILSLQIVTSPDVVKTSLAFADSLFSETGSKHRCLWSLTQTFALWSSTTPLMQQRLVEQGLMIGVLLELQAFRNLPNSEDVSYLIQLGLSILCNLLQVPSNVAYFTNTICDQIVGYFITSTDPKVRILSTSILCYLKPKLPPDFQLDLQDEDIKLILDLVPSSIMEYSIMFNPISLLASLCKIVMTSESIARKLISRGLVSVISKLLESSSCVLQREMVLLLWSLASYSTLAEKISSEVEVLAVVNRLKSSGDCQLATASMCASWDININKQPKDDEGYIEFAYGCYQFRKYDRCATACEAILQHLSSDADLQKINLLRGKSLFHLCNAQIQRLPKIISPSDRKLRSTLNLCIEYATEAVTLLGHALDQDCIDDDGSRYLDLCMMFLISSSNSLNKCQRCLLCRSNLNLGQEVLEQESTEAAKKHRKLQRSHIVPKAILEAFTSGLVKTKSQRLFQFCGTETILSKLKSAKESTYFMLCSKCEQRFGAFENEFINNFFKKIYDVAAPLEAQKISYSSWLYQFCISLFFRGVAILDIPCNDDVKRFQNSEKLYEIFVRCRQILLGRPPSEPKYPSVYVLINSITPTTEESQSYTTIHEALVSPEMIGMAAEKDPKKYFVGTARANLFLAHMGIINVVIDVEGIIQSQDHLINSSDGLYQVPHESQRNQFIPPDVKEVFYTSARHMEIERETISDKLRKSHWAKGVLKSPPRDQEETFMIHPAQKKDLEVLRQQKGVKPSQIPGKDKIVSFLPQGFQVVQTSGILELPPGHRVLFHSEPARSPQDRSYSSDTGMTIFLAIGDGSKEYPADKPYAIYHKYDSGLQFNMAMFVSDTDLSVLSLITSGSRQQRAESLFNDSFFRENMQLSLKTAMYQMGFASFNSFLPHSHEKRIQSRCQKKRRCWYCNDRCDNCMKVAAVGYTREISGVVVKFCSQECSDEFGANPRVLNLLPSVFSLTKEDSKVTTVPPHGHKMLQRVNDHFDEDEEALATIRTTRVCVGNDSVEFPNNKVYIIHETSTVLSHTLLAFVVNDDFSISPLPSTPQEEVVMWFAKCIQPYLRSVLQDIVSQAGFSTSKEWCTAAIQGTDTYFASQPFYKQY